MKIRKYSENDVPAMIRIWNEVVEEFMMICADMILAAFLLTS